MSNQLTVTPRDLSANTIPGGNGWLASLDKSEKGNTLPSLPNARRIIMNHPFLKDCFKWSEFDESPMLMRPLPCMKSEGLIPPDVNGVYPQRFSDKFHTYLRDVMSIVAEANFKDSDIKQAVQNAAQQNIYNPIRDYLNSLTWNGVPRIDNWLHDGLAAEDTELNSKMGRMFLIAACRRACFRKYKFDSMLILEGPKGLQKSTACRVLFGDDYFVEGTGDIRKEETIKKLAGKWAAEIPEGNGFLSASAEAQKEFLSKEADTYRRAYATWDCTVPRRFVLIMTTNASEYLQETETDRRFWSVKCGATGNTDVDWIQENRDQLWAEAYHFAMLKDEQGKLVEQTYLNPEDIIRLGCVQIERVIDDPWGNIIRRHLLVEAEGIKEITTMQLLNNVLAIPTDRQDKSAMTKIGYIMRDMGWSKVRRRDGSVREYVYVRPEK